jgi:hypothetical protein
MIPGMRLVDRLRDPARGWHPDQVQAADEIERLQSDAERHVEEKLALAATVRRLREALANSFCIHDYLVPDCELC